MSIDSMAWDTPTIDADDQQLIEAYERLKIPLDSLVYTPEFKQLVRNVGASDENDESLRLVYLKLLGLRKRGVLPRVY